MWVWIGVIVAVSCSVLYNFVGIDPFTNEKPESLNEWVGLLGVGIITIYVINFVVDWYS